MEKQVNPKICLYCINRTSSVCEVCQTEGRYRFLEVETLPNWEPLPELPSMREIVDLPASERLAILWLHVRYGERERTRNGDI